MSRLLKITDIAPPQLQPLKKSVHPLFCDNISIFDWLQTTADIPDPQKIMYFIFKMLFIPKRVP